MLPALLLGLATGLSLIVAIGAQNAFVLRLGLHAPARVVAPVVALCAGSDAVLIVAGAFGLGALIEAAPAFVTAVRLVGAAFLLVYGLLAARRAWRGTEQGLDVEGVRSGGPGEAGRRGQSLGATLATAAAFTWLNPHVYLDTVVFLGSVAAHQGPGLRWWFAGGAAAASVVWFTALGFGARALRPVFTRPGAWRALDAVIAVVMLALGVGLLLS
ncbi:MAG: LysE family transporter [Kineosporiaceae bacterium]